MDRRYRPSLRDPGVIGRRGFKTRRQHGTPRLTVGMPRQQFGGGAVGNGVDIGDDGGVGAWSSSDMEFCQRGGAEMEQTTRGGPLRRGFYRDSLR